MYIYGGRGDIHAPYHSQEEIYCPKIVYLDLKSNHWITPTVTGKIPIGRRSHSACKLMFGKLQTTQTRVIQHDNICVLF